MNNSRFFGIDLSKQSMMVAIANDKNKKMELKKYKTDPEGRINFISTLNKTDIVALETGNCSFLFAYQIIDIVGCKVYVLNAGKLHIIFKSHKKTDKEDAIKIVKFIQRTPEEELPIVSLPTEEEVLIRSMVKERERLQKYRTQALNALHNLFWNKGITNLIRSDLSNQDKRDENIKYLPQENRSQAKRLSKQITIFDEQLSELETEENTILKKNLEAISISMSVPGIGPKTALVLLAYVGDMSRFDNRRQISHYSGFTPRIDCSGMTNRYGHITREGPRLLRRVLVQSAWACIRSKDGYVLKEFYEGIKVRRGKRIAIVAVARKILEIVYTLYKTGSYYNTNNTNTKKVVEKKIKFYKLI